MENWISFSPLFCPETEFSSDVDRRNSITSRPFSGQSHIRVAHLVFKSRINSLGDRSVFAFYLLLFAFIRISVFSCRAIDMGLVTFCYVCILDGAERLPPLLPRGDGRLCSTGQHYPGFPRVQYNTLIRLGYDGDTLVYHC
jgi:hypothetical protein